MEGEGTNGCEHVWDQRGEGWFCVVCHRFQLTQPRATEITYDKAAFDIISGPPSAGRSEK